MQNKNVITNILVVIVVLIVGVLIGLFVSNKDSVKNKNLENNQIVVDDKIQNSTPTNKVEQDSLPKIVISDDLHKTCVDQTGDYPVPVITSISPNSGPVGTPIEVRGCNLNGFEGDLVLQIKNVDGVTAVIYGQGQSSPIETKKIIAKIKKVSGISLIEPKDTITKKKIKAKNGIPNSFKNFIIYYNKSNIFLI